MRLVFILILFSVTFSVFSQSNLFEKSNNISDTTIYEFVDEEATFPGGFPAMMKFIQENIIYPDSFDYYNFQIKITLRFVVETDGTLSHFEVLQSTNSELKQAYLNLLSKMPKWIHGKINGNAVRQLVRVPIIICLKE